MRRLASSQRFVPYVFVLPFIISVVLFYLYPAVSTVIMSFQEVVPGESHFIGLRNYDRLINPDFFTALKNSFIYTVLTIAVLIPLPMVLGVLLKSSRRGLNNVFRAMLFLPALLSVVVAGTIFRLTFASSHEALVNALLIAVGLSPQEWLLGGASQAMFLLVMVATWRWTGVNIVYFLSGLQAIPNELYESASIDGANPLQKLLRITIPLLKPTTVFVVTISIFGGFAMFEESYILWGGGGGGGGNSPNNVGLTMVGYIYRKGFQSGEMGLGSAIGIVLLVIVLLISLVELRATGFFREERA